MAVPPESLAYLVKRNFLDKATYLWLLRKWREIQPRVLDSEDTRANDRDNSIIQPHSDKTLIETTGRQMLAVKVSEAISFRRTRLRPGLITAVETQGVCQIRNSQSA